MADPVVQKFLADGGQIFRLYEGEITITVAYKTGSVSVDGYEIEYVLYGSSIHRKSSKSDSFMRKPHNYTAVRRCTTKPVAVPGPFESYTGLQAKVRLAMYTYGCSEKRDFQETDPEYLARVQCAL